MEVSALEQLVINEIKSLREENEKLKKQLKKISEGGAISTQELQIGCAFVPSFYSWGITKENLDKYKEALKRHNYKEDEYLLRRGDLEIKTYEYNYVVKICDETFLFNITHDKLGNIVVLPIKSDTDRPLRLTFKEAEDDLFDILKELIERVEERENN